MVKRQKYIDGIMKYVNAPFVKILTGIRRCGKSTIMQMIQDELRQEGIREEQIIKYNFDLMKYVDMTAKELYSELKNKINSGKKTYLFLDEVQEIDGWEKIVNTFMTEYDTDIFVTGSNSRMMSSEISTYLTGRYISFRIFPLSFEEYLEFRNKYTTPVDRKTELKRYLQLGGFPAIHLREYTADEVYPIVKDIYREYGRLLSIEDNYPKYVLTTDEFAGGNYQGIKTMHIADFLLSQEY
ncbi:MAG: ATP-binding protein [Lachnospiraceae bacterium]|nr:ATP-binding protein [Lachnospiraceae bacterium]